MSMAGVVGLEPTGRLLESRRLPINGHPYVKIPLKRHVYHKLYYAICHPDWLFNRSKICYT